MEAADELIAHTDSQKTKQELSEKNERRRDALEGLRHEIKDEAKARKNKKR